MLPRGYARLLERNRFCHNRYCRSFTSAYRYQLYVFCGRHVRLEWARKLGLKSFDLGGPYDKALDAVCERLGVS